MNPKALLSTFITLAFIFPAAGIVFRKVFVICMKIFIFIDFSNAPEGFRDKMRGLFNKSLDILNPSYEKFCVRSANFGHI